MSGGGKHAYRASDFIYSRPNTVRGRSAEFASGATKPPRISQVVKGQATDEVHLTDVSDTHDDETLAKHAGYDSSHQGFNVVRYPDSPDATVHLWKQ